MHIRKIATASLSLIAILVSANTFAAPETTKKTGGEVFERIRGLLGGATEKAGRNGRMSCKLKLVTGQGRSSGINGIVIEKDGKDFGINLPQSIEVNVMSEYYKENGDSAEVYNYSFGGFPIQLSVLTNQNMGYFVVELEYSSMRKSSYCYFQN